MSVSWNSLPDEIVEHILSYYIADQLRSDYDYLPLINFEHNPKDCGIRSYYIPPWIRTLQFEKRCRHILKGMCVFKRCLIHKEKKEWDFRGGILHNRK